MALSVVLVACSDGSAEVTTYTDPDQLSMFSVPSDWHLYESEELASLGQTPFASTLSGLTLPVISRVAFDGSPDRDVANLSGPVAGAAFPIGSSVVRTIDDSDRDFVSRIVLTQSVLPYRNFTDPQEIVKEDFEFPNDFDGVRVLATFTDPDNNSNGAVYLIAVTDPEDRRLYSMAVGCSVACFQNFQDEIVEVVDSWLVNVRS